MMKRYKMTMNNRLTNNAYVEIILGYALLTLFNFLWLPKQMGYVDIHPHPYWMVILLVAARYGFRPGLWAGILGGVLEFVLGPLRIFFQDPLAEFDLSILHDTVIFICVGAIIGEIREIQKRAYIELREHHDELEKNYQTLKTHFNALSEAKQELDASVISHKDTLATLHDAAQALRSLKEEDIYPAVLELLKTYVGVEASSLYAQDGHSLILKAFVSEGEKPRNSRIEDLETGIIGKALHTGRLVSLNSLLSGTEEEESAGGIIICAPVLDTSGKPYGVINIEKIPFVKFNPLALRMTGLISDWCGAALENALIYKDAKEKDIIDDETGAYNAVYLQKRLQEEFQRARRYRIPLTVMVLELAEFEQYLPEKKPEALRLVSQLLKKMIRSVDLLFRMNEPARFVLVLPNTDLVGARILNSKINKETNLFKLPVTSEQALLKIKSGLSFFNETTDDSGKLLLSAVDNLRENDE